MENTTQAREPKETTITNLPEEELQTEDMSDNIIRENDEELLDDDVEEGSIADDDTEDTDIKSDDGSEDEDDFDLEEKSATESGL